MRGWDQAGACVDSNLAGVDLTKWTWLIFASFRFLSPKPEGLSLIKEQNHIKHTDLDNISETLESSGF